MLRYFLVPQLLEYYSFYSSTIFVTNIIFTLLDVFIQTCAIHTRCYFNKKKLKVNRLYTKCVVYNTTVLRVQQYNGLNNNRIFIFYLLTK